MRIFLAGATGVIGSRLVPLLVASGHHVARLTRSPDRGRTIVEQGARAVVGDVFDRVALVDAVRVFGPDLVMHQLTDLPDDPGSLPLHVQANARIRTEGTDNLLAAATAAGASRFIAQSVAWPLSGEGGRAVEYLESAVLAFGGVVLRYGQFYGPGTFHPEPPPPPRIHVDEAARLTVDALEAPGGTIEIVEPES